MNAFEAMKAGASSRKAAAPSSTSPAMPPALPWVEKYRPKSIEKVEGQESTTRVLAKALHRADVSRSVFYARDQIRNEAPMSDQHDPLCSGRSCLTCCSTVHLELGKHPLSWPLHESCSGKRSCFQLFFCTLRSHIT